MTDDELIELIESKPPRELAAAELQLLRSRLAASPELRAAIAERLELDRFLAGALDPLTLDAEAVLKVAGLPESRPSRWPRRSMVAGLMVFVAIAWVWWLISRGDPRGDLSSPDSDNDAPAIASPETEAAAAAVREGPADRASEAEMPSAPGRPAADAASGTTNDHADDVARQAAATAAAPDSNPPAETVREREPPAGATLFPELDRRTPSASQAELALRLQPVPGKPFNLSQRDVAGVQCGVLDGAARLVAALPEGTVLRLTLAEFNQLRITLAAGDQGVQLQYFEHANRTWAAYRVRRDPADDQFKPEALLATDEDRFWRTNPAPPTTFDLRHHDGQVVLSRGDVRMLSAPLSDRPGLIFFEGRAIFRQLETAPAAPLPTEPASAVDGRRIVNMTEARGLLGDLPRGAQLEHHQDGTVELSADDTERPAWLAWPMPTFGVHEVILQIERATPGAAVYLGDGDGQPKYQVGLFRERRSGRVVVGPQHPGERRWETEYDSNHQPVPWVEGKFWIRLLFGCGQFKSWLSGDGRNWARANSPWTNQGGDWQSVGIACIGGNQPPRSIRWRALELRPLAGINGCAPEALLPAAAAAATAADLNAWIRDVSALRPEQARSAEWRRACAVRALARGTNSALGAALIDQLVSQSLVDRGLDADQGRLLNDAALLLPTWEDARLAQRALEYFEKWGLRLRERGERRAYSIVARAQRIAPLWTPHSFDFLSAKLLRAEAIDLASAERWTDLRSLAAQQRFWRRPAWGQRPEPTLLDWFDALAARLLPRDSSASLTVRDDWQHPVMIDPNKLAYDLHAEFTAALAQGAQDDACQALAAASNESLGGLFYDREDPNLLVAFPVVVETALANHRTLRDAIASRLGPAGKLRVRQAIGDNDVVEVKASATRFLGTEAAAEARAWLGDRALAAGQFAEAIDQYRRAMADAPAALTARVAAGAELSAAMLGESLNASPGADLRWGDRTFSPADIEQLVAAARGASQSRTGWLNAAAAPVPSAPPPAEMTAVARARIDGEQGDSPQDVPEDVQRSQVDWPSRQSSLTVHDDKLIYSNRFQVALFDGTSGQMAWRTGLGADQGRAHLLGLSPMRPLVARDRIFVRRMHRLLPLLACLELSSGRLLWSAAAESAVVSDPLLIHGELLALTVSRLDQGLELALAQFDAETGAQVRTAPLMMLRESWWQDHACQVRADQDRLFVLCGGAVFCCNARGELLWLRRQMHLPPSLDRAWVEQHHDPPLIVDGKLIASQPGVRAVECLDAANGRRIWQHVAPDLRRVLGRLDRRLFVETAAGVEALELATGKLLWRSPQSGALSAALCGEPGGLVISRAVATADKPQATAALVWLEPTNGRERQRALLRDITGEAVRLGSLASAGARWWCLASRDGSDPSPELIELAPGPSAAAP